MIGIEAHTCNSNICEAEAEGHVFSFSYMVSSNLAWIKHKIFVWKMVAWFSYSYNPEISHNVETRQGLLPQFVCLTVAYTILPIPWWYKFCLKSVSVSGDRFQACLAESLSHRHIFFLLAWPWWQLINSRGLPVPSPGCPAPVNGAQGTCIPTQT